VASSPPPWPAPELALELFQNGRIFQRGGVLRELFALGQAAQQTTHDLARTGFRQIVTETDVLRLGDRSDLLAHPVLQFLDELLGIITGRANTFQHDESDDSFTGQVIRATNNSSLGNLRIGNQCGFDFIVPIR
jgi:hypothetical protein